MFKISTPRPAPTPAYLLVADENARAEEGDMDLDTNETDPSMTSNAEARVAIPGETIANAQEWMRGHGTYVSGGAVVASVAGQVERVNKLVSVRPIRAKYRPQVGDLVIGRITEVGPRRWRVDANGRLDAVLMLSSINLPGGVQRRKLESDELQMRTYFQEGDLLVAEVQAVMFEGTMSLHTRSLKYGKLRNGTIVVVPSTLVVRLKSHFHTLACGVDLILGLNGYIWVQASAANSSSNKADSAATAAAGATLDERGEGSASMAIYSSKNDAISAPARAAIDRVATCITILARNSVIITDVNVEEAYEASMELRGEDGDEIDTDQLYREDATAGILAAIAARN